MNVNKAVIIGIIVSGIAIGILSGFSLGSFSGLEGEAKIILENVEDLDNEEPKPQGRDLSIEFNEKMGLSAP